MLEAEETLRQAAGIIPESAAAHHALGLSLVGEKHYDAALEELRQAATLDPESAKYLYV